MDENKAIEILKKSAEERRRVYELMFGEKIPPEFREDIDAEELAIKALEKQIPKEVKYLNRHGGGYDLYNKDYYNCPTCGRRLRNKKLDPYCPRCGQKIFYK